MNTVAREHLIRLYAEKGDAIARDAQMCEAILLDSCGGCKKEISVIVGAVRCGVASELVARSASSPQSTLRQVLISRMRDEQGFANDAAAWAVDTWRDAIRETTTVPRKQTTPPKAASDKSRLGDTLVEDGFKSFGAQALVIAVMSWATGDLWFPTFLQVLVVVNVCLIVLGFVMGLGNGSQKRQKEQ